MNGLAMSTAESQQQWIGPAGMRLGAAAPRWLARCAAVVAGVLLSAMASAVGENASATPGSAASAATHPIPASRAAKNLAIITIHGEIDAVTTHSVKRRIDEAVRAGADGLVFEINSPGGEVVAGLGICKAIKQAPVNTIAWINPEAYSMAAIIALACDEIVVAPHATMGDAAPIAVTFNPLAPGGPGVQTLGATERQKIMAPLIAEVVESARINGYDENLVQGFITLGVELWLIREKDTGRQLFVTEWEYRVIFGTPPPRGPPHIPSGVFTETQAAEGQRTPPTQSEDPWAFRPAFGEIDEQAKQAIDLRLEGTPSGRPVFSPADRERYEYVEYATDGRTLLTLKEADLKRYGFTDPAVTIRDDQEMQQYVGATHVRRLDQSWSEHLVAFMTQGVSGMVVKGLLIVVFLLAMFVEMSMPGVGLPGLIALIALVGLVVPPMLIGAANWWMGAMIVGGIGLLLLEIFVLPGFGVPGVIGLIMLFAGLVGMFAAPGQLFPGTGPGGLGELARAGSIVLLALFVAGVGIYLFTKYTSRFPIMGKLVLADGGPASNDDSGMLAAMAPPTPRGPVSVGQIGRTTTPLRPSGTAEFGDKLVDVVSEFGFVDAGVAVRVTSVADYRVGVEAIRDGTAPPLGPNLNREKDA